MSTPVQVDPEKSESILLDNFNCLFVSSNAFFMHSSDIYDAFFIKEHKF